MCSTLGDELAVARCDLDLTKSYKSTTFTGAGLDAREGLELLALGYLGGIGSIAGAVIGAIYTKPQPSSAR